MKLKILSDLHVEFNQYTRVLPEHGDADVLVIPGDVGTDPERTVEWLDANRHGLPVVFTCGNHEYYGNDLRETDFRFKGYAEQHDWLHFLQDGNALYVQGQAFAGGTLWTDFRAADPMVMGHCQMTMNDYNTIRLGDRRLTPADTYDIHLDTVAMLEHGLCNDPATIIVTHMAPHELCVHDRFKHDWMTNHAYYTDLQWLMEKYNPTLWVHGHMHDGHDFAVGETRVICNPYGYDGHFAGEVNPTFNDNLVYTR